MHKENFTQGTKNLGTNQESMHKELCSNIAMFRQLTT